MAADKAKSDKPKTKTPQPKPVKDPKAEAKEKEKKARAHAKAEAKAAEAEASKTEAPAPRAPADPRQKVMKKFEGRFLPKGPLRDRYKAIRQRWDAADDHGDVTVDELKALLADWRASQAKPARTRA